MQLIQKLRREVPLPLALWEMIRTHSQNVLTRRASMTKSLASSSPSITLRSIRSSDLLRLSTSNSFFWNENWKMESVQNHSWKSNVYPEAKHGDYKISISNTGKRKPAVPRGSLVSQSSFDKLQANERPRLYNRRGRNVWRMIPKIVLWSPHECIDTCTFIHLPLNKYLCAYIQKRAIRIDLDNL